MNNNEQEQEEQKIDTDNAPLVSAVVFDEKTGTLTLKLANANPPGAAIFSVFLPVAVCRRACIKSR